MLLDVSRCMSRIGTLTAPPRWLRRLLIALGVFVALLIVGRLVLDPLADRYLRRQLAKGKNMQGTFSSLHISIIPPAAEVWNFKLIEKPGGRWDEPLVYSQYTRASVLWRQLFHGHVVGQVRMENPKLVMLRQHEKKAAKAPAAAEEAQEMFPLKLDLLEIVDGEVLLGIGKGKKAPQLWLHDLELVANNMATKKALMEGEPSTLTLTGYVQSRGKLKATAEMDPFAKQLTFSTKGSLVGLKARDLYSFLAHQSDLKAESGEIDVFFEARAKDGVLRGGVKPILKNLEIRSDTKDLGDRIKAALADTAVELLSDDIPGRDAVATTIPIRGKIDDPKAQLLPTVLGVIRNAFVVGLGAGFSNLPPQVAEKKESSIKQAWDALTDDKGPPEAQPEKGEQASKDEKPGKAGDKPAQSSPRRGRSSKPR
jgi:Domain of Unknown Function (DUF748)